jgi:hypothetical protein
MSTETRPRRSLLASRPGRTAVTGVRIGFTGHQSLSPETAVAVRQALDRLLAAADTAVGICSLAAGSDQIFAQAVLAGGHSLEAVIPSAGYRTTFDDPDDLARYETLLVACSAVTELDHPAPDHEAFYAAGRLVADSSDRLIAVWDGKPAAGLGGTADVVDYARALGHPVDVVWPAGSSRS